MRGRRGLGHAAIHLTSLFALALARGPAVAQAGGALQCDGVDDYVTIPDANDLFDLPMAMTLEAWVRYDNPIGIETAIGGHFANVGGSYALLRDNPPNIRFAVSTPATNSAGSAGTVGAGEWTHIAGSYDGATLRVYVNGALAGTAPQTGTVTDVTELWFCRFPLAAGGGFLDGQIDEVRIWGVVRSASQIAAHYRFPLEGDETGLAGYYRFDEGDGQTIQDSSIFDSHGFLGAGQGAGTDDPTRVLSSAPIEEAPPCIRDDRTACLLDGRFRVTVQMQNFAHPPVVFPGTIQTYGGQSSETDQSVSFYSFQEGNVEVFVKMVDACAAPAFNSFWLFAAGATTADTHITVDDTLSPETYSINNPSGQLFLPVADTLAFLTCD
jgi:hypothetical protein